jgi:hypothetical protein
MPNRFYIPDKTWVDLGQKPNFEKFIKAYFDLLQKKLQHVEVKGNNYTYSYYTCGQLHDPRNPDWKPFKILWQICKKYDYDPFIAREIIEDHIGRKLTCECQVLNDERAIRRKKLEIAFGLDFGGPGRRDFDII